MSVPSFSPCYVESHVDKVTTRLIQKLRDENKDLQQQIKTLSKGGVNTRSLPLQQEQGLSSKRVDDLKRVIAFYEKLSGISVTLDTRYFLDTLPVPFVA